MFVVWLVLILAESAAVLVFVVPIAVAILWQLWSYRSKVELLRVPKVRPPIFRLSRWLIIVGVLVAVSLVVSATGIVRQLMSVVPVGQDFGGGSAIDVVLAESSVWCAVLAVPVALVTLGKLHEAGYRDAAPIAFAVWAVPSSAVIFGFGGSEEGALVGIALVSAGLTLSVAAWVSPSAKLTSALWITTVAVFLFVGSGFTDPRNALWFFPVFASGYAVYRIQWKSLIASGTLDDQGVNSNLEPATLAAGANSRSYLRRRSDFIEYGLTVAFVLIAIAATWHLATMPEVQVWSGIEGVNGALWKIVLSTLACAGAFGIAVSTISRAALYLRPSFVSLVLPAAIVLPIAELAELRMPSLATDWLPSLIQVGIIGCALWAMWYVFGPGGRTARDEVAA